MDHLQQDSVPECHTPAVAIRYLPIQNVKSYLLQPPGGNQVWKFWYTYTDHDPSPPKYTPIKCLFMYTY